MKVLSLYLIHEQVNKQRQKTGEVRSKCKVILGYACFSSRLVHYESVIHSTFFLHIT